ncbi:MAG: uroporphyrinogen-III decarboxylase-like protein [Phycisphaerae bacterium]|nr:uroporphyrinogen-III decarboxylase-like protein [Phycisphaerae bacterium]
MESTYRRIDDIGIRPAPEFSQLRKVLMREGRPDFVPFYELFVDRPIMEQLLGKPVADAAATVEFYHRAGYDYVPVWPTLRIQTGSLVDTTGDYPITDRESFQRYPWPEPETVGFDDFEAVASVLPAGMKMIGQTGGIFEMAESLCGYNNLCLLLADDRDLVHAIFERIGRIYEAMYAGMTMLPEVGSLVISDDLGFKTQTLISPADIRTFVFPWYQRLVDIVHGQNKPCILHSCGNLAAIMDELIDTIRIDAKHSYEDAILPVTEAAERYGDRIAILGGFDVDRLCRSSQTEIRKHVNLLMTRIGKTGRYALGSGNSIADYVPVDKYLTMLDEGWRWRV